MKEVRQKFTKNSFLGTTYIWEKWCFHFPALLHDGRGGVCIRSKMVARWASELQNEQSILHLVHGSYKSHHEPKLAPLRLLKWWEWYTETLITFLFMTLIGVSVCKTVITRISSGVVWPLDAQKWTYVRKPVLSMNVINLLNMTPCPYNFIWIVFGWRE